MTHPFPHSMDFAGHNEPMRVECDIYDLEVIEGAIPAEISGTWFRSVPDPQYPPLPGDDVFISGDGMVNALSFDNGHADFKMRYVMTERLKNDRAARRSLYGKYRNPLTDDASVQGKPRGVANTTPVWHGGRLLALKEDSRAVELDPHTLATLGEFDYGGKLKSQTMTAHPRVDPDTGELYFFGYEAGGLVTTDVAYCVADRHGELTSEQWFKLPWVSMMHDFAITKEHAIFPVFPTVSDMDKLKAGIPHWAWDATKPARVGIMPRNGKVDQLRWFEGPPGFAYHMMNAFTDGSKVHLDLCVADINMFPFVMAAGGYEYDPAQANGRLARWTFDLAGSSDTWQETVIGPGGDMPRVAEHDQLKDYSIAYMAAFNPELGPPILSGPTPAGFNSLLRINVRTGAIAAWAQPGTTLQEPVLIKSRQHGHEGYLAAVCDIHATNTAEVLLFSAADVAGGPLARLKVPMRLRCGVHGNWVPREDLPARREEIFGKIVRLLAAQTRPESAAQAPRQDAAEAMPAAIEASDAAAEPGRAAALPALDAAAPAALRILVVDDNVANQQLLQSQLRALGHTAELAANGRLGLDAWLQHRHGLIFVDCTMPVMNGFEMARSIRALEQGSALPATRIVAITGSPEEYQQQCSEAGMDILLGKPLLLNILRETLTRLFPTRDGAPTC